MKKKNLNVFMWVFAASLFLFASCQKEEMLEPKVDSDAGIESEVSLEKTEKCGRYDQLYVLTQHLTRKTWTYYEVFHDDSATNALLNVLFAELTFDFYTDGTYHIVIPGTGRDDVGTWEFVDNGQRILADKGMETEHYVIINALTAREFNFTINDPEIGPWSIILVPINSRYDKGHGHSRH